MRILFIHFYSKYRLLFLSIQLIYLLNKMEDEHMNTYKFDTKAIHFGQEPLQWLILYYFSISNNINNPCLF